MKKYTLLLLLVFTTSVLFAQHPTNLLPIEQWEEGQGSVGDFTEYAFGVENTRKFINGPEDYDVIGWNTKGIPGTFTLGGFNSEFIPDVSKTYRYSIWVRRNDSNLGQSYLFGPVNATLDLNGNVGGATIFWTGSPPTTSEWYLIVGFIHSNTYTGTVSFGGIYNNQGEKVGAGTDFKWLPTAVNSRYAVICTSIPVGESEDYFAPRVDIVNGNEPTIASLIGSGGGGSQIWSEITDGAVYNEGSVGIGVDENDMDTDYKFLVDGDIKTRKVKVTLDGWADYVFEDSYPLLPLEEVEAFITNNGHLPEIPSEETVLEDGIYLGEMDVSLLKKIEELTLYILEMKKEIQQLKQENKAMKSRPSRE